MPERHWLSMHIWRRNTTTKGIKLPFPRRARLLRCGPTIPSTIWLSSNLALSCVQKRIIMWCSKHNSWCGLKDYNTKTINKNYTKSFKKKSMIFSWKKKLKEREKLRHTHFYLCLCLGWSPPFAMTLFGHIVNTEPYIYIYIYKNNMKIICKMLLFD